MAVIKGLQKFNAFIVYLWDRFFDDGCSNRAASLAYSTLLSLVPLLMVVFWVLSYFPIFRGTGLIIQQFILENFVADSSKIIEEHLNIFLGQMGVLSWLNWVSLALVSILMMYNLVEAFNAIWRVKVQRHLAISFVIYILVLLISPLLFGILILASSYFLSLPLVAATKIILFIKKPLLILFPFLSAFLTFTLFNWVLPSCKVSLRYAMFSGLITAIFFELAKYLFALYLSYFPTYRLVYGALATIPIFLIWMYVTWSIVLLGAIICHALHEKHPP